jgi:integrase/recombinase XerD
MGSVRFSGPLVPYADGFARELARLGFTPLSADGQLRLAAHLSRWMAGGSLGVADLTAVRIRMFLDARRESGHTAYLTVKSLVPLLGYLRGLGAVPEEAVPLPATPAEELLEGFRSWLLSERGLCPDVVSGYADLVRPFVTARAACPSETTTADVIAFVVAESRRLAPKTAQRAATAMRSLLRFWLLEGLMPRPLDDAVPRIANRRPALPRGLGPAQVSAMLSSCDRGTAAGRRDLAILTLLSRMGLRAGEAVALTLDDIDWRAGEITVRGKGNRRDRLPLPADAGRALADWLRHGRPATALDRSVFTRMKAPHRGLTPGGITQAVAAAARRAGLGTVYAHRLRHSAATGILAGGGSLEEIGQLLRHQRPHTTAAYTKVSIAALRALARPWPDAS